MVGKERRPWQKTTRGGIPVPADDASLICPTRESVLRADATNNGTRYVPYLAAGGWLLSLHHISSQFNVYFCLHSKL